MALQEDEIVQLFDAASRNISVHRVLDVRSQSLMSWSKEAALNNILVVNLTFLMSQLSSGWSKEAASWNISTNTTKGAL